MTTTKAVTDKETGKSRHDEDGHARARTKATAPTPRSTGLAALKPVFGRRQADFITAGNASQLSDGASACVLMEREVAEQARLEPLGIYRGMAVAGCEPDEMGIGPVFAIPKLLERTGSRSTTSTSGS